MAYTIVCACMCWELLVVALNCLYVIVCSSMCLYVLLCSCLCLYVPVCACMCLYVTVCPHMFLYMLVCAGICLYALACAFLKNKITLSCQIIIPGPPLVAIVLVAVSHSSLVLQLDVLFVQRLHLLAHLNAPLLKRRIEKKYL